jgi:hypothetical protein
MEHAAGHQVVIYAQIGGRRPRGAAHPRLTILLRMVGEGGVRVAASDVADSRGVASGRSSCRRCAMAALLIGYARCSTD